MRKIYFLYFHVFSEARDHILILNILFFNKLRQIIPEVRSEMRDFLIFIFILKTTGTFTPVHSAGYLILRNEFRSTQAGRIYKYNSYMIYIIRNSILWLGISAYGGGVFVSLFFDRRCSPDYFLRNVNKMAAWIPDNKKR
jgi:hypothetical protein